MTAAYDDGHGGGWSLLVDGRPHGRHPDLEDANRLLSRLGLAGAELGGSPLCDWREDTAALPAGGGPRPNAGVPCGLYASRTVIWESPGMFGVRLCCAGHVRAFRDVSAEWFTWVLPRPAARGDHTPGFDKFSGADMGFLAELLTGERIPPGTLPGLPRVRPRRAGGRADKKEGQRS